MSLQTHLAVSDQQIVIEVGGETRSGRATEIMELASDPALRPAVTIRFHATVLAVAIRLRPGDSGVAAEAIAINGDMHIPLTGQVDHVLVADDWFPLDPGTHDAVSDWIRTRHQGVIDLAAYSELYRGLSSTFVVVDELADEDVSRLLIERVDPAGLEAKLYPYQMLGLQWLAAHSTAAIGGILADEMGLGKTLQAIGLLELERERARGPSLVVMPLTLLENWSREIRRFAPMLRFYRHHGQARTRRASAITGVDVVLTTYETVVSDIATLGEIEWNVIFTDEAQAYKNPTTQRASALSRLRGRVIIAMTGTPLENRALDLWSIANTVEPGYLGDRPTFDAVLERDPRQLRNAVRPLLLRRVIADVARDLPERIDIDVALEMFGPEADAYGSILDGVRSSSGTPLAVLTRLRQFTAHPHSIGQLHDLSAVDASAKFARLLEIVEEIALAGQKVLIFAAFHAPADLIGAAINQRLDIATWYLDGRVPPAQRQPTIDRFSDLDGPGALIGNPSAAGVGLNITAASHVIHYTLEWNPAKEDQATARAWRRGQARPVTVHRLFYIETIDEVITEKLVGKRRLFDEVIEAGGAESEAEISELVAAALTRAPKRQTGRN